METKFPSPRPLFVLPLLNCFFGPFLCTASYFQFWSLRYFVGNFLIIDAISATKKVERSTSCTSAKTASFGPFLETALGFQTCTMYIIYGTLVCSDMFKEWPKMMLIYLFCTIKFQKRIKHEIFQSRVGNISTELAFTSSWSEYSDSPKKHEMFTICTEEPFPPEHFLSPVLFISHSARAEDHRGLLCA